MLFSNKNTRINKQLKANYFRKVSSRNSSLLSITKREKKLVTSQNVNTYTVKDKST